MFLINSMRENLKSLEKANGLKLFSALLFTILLCLILVSETQAATFTVDTTTDAVILSACTPAAGDCTLRGAISVATGAGDIIDFDPGVFATAQTITLVPGEISITTAITTGPLTINGPGANLLTISGNGTSRVFSIGSGVTLTITDLAISNGNGNGVAQPGFGGGIYNQGNLTLTNVTVDSNETILAGNGGGIYNDNATLIIENSTISNNEGVTGAGGIINFFNSTLTITNSTISGNTALSGGGGGIVNLATATVLSSTIANNMAIASAGGGVNEPGVPGSSFTSENSIYGNNSDNGTAPDFSGDLNSTTGYNLVENVMGTTFVGTTTGNITGMDPGLGPLQFNGGITQTETHALVGISPAIDTGLSALTTDQRGLMRPIDIGTIANGTGNASDIGAFEVQAITAASITISGRVLSPFGRGVSQAMVYMTNLNGDILVARTNPFGYYRFENIEVGQTLVFNVFSKRYQFLPQVVEVNEKIGELNFIAQ